MIRFGVKKINRDVNKNAPMKRLEKGGRASSS